MANFVNISKTLAGVAMLVMLPGCPATPYLGTTNAFMFVLEEPGDFAEFEFTISIAPEALDYVTGLEEEVRLWVTVDHTQAFNAFF